jgi:hypothetical protein
MSGYTRLSNYEKQEILRRRGRGESQMAIAAALGRVPGTVHAFLRQHAEVPGLPALTSYGAGMLGPSLVEWAAEHHVHRSPVFGWGCSTTDGSSPRLRP